MKSISAVIITYNEEKNIGRCLDSLQGIADEIVVLDSFSTDATKAICAAKGAKFVQHAFSGYIEQKNVAISCALHDFVLSLDADEALSEPLKAAILQAKQSGTAEAYTMNRLNNYCGQWIHHSGWYPDRKIRLFDRRKAAWGGINPHDKIVVKSGIKVSFLQGDLLHFTYYSRQEHLMRSEKYANIAAAAKYTQGQKATLFKVYLSPLFSVIKQYVFQLGFLDGKAGYHIARITAREKYLKYSALRKLWATT